MRTLSFTLFLSVSRHISTFNSFPKLHEQYQVQEEEYNLSGKREYYA